MSSYAYTVQLKETSHWVDWYIQLKSNADDRNIWHLVDPEGEDAIIDDDFSRPQRPVKKVLPADATPGAIETNEGNKFGVQDVIRRSRGALNGRGCWDLGSSSAAGPATLESS